VVFPGLSGIEGAISHLLWTGQRRPGGWCLPGPFRHWGSDQSPAMDRSEKTRRVMSSGACLALRKRSVTCYGPVREDNEGAVFREIESIRRADPLSEVWRLKHSGRILDLAGRRIKQGFSEIRRLRLVGFQDVNNSAGRNRNMNSGHWWMGRGHSSRWHRPGMFYSLYLI